MRPSQVRLFDHGPDGQNRTLDGGCICPSSVRIPRPTGETRPADLRHRLRPGPGAAARGQQLRGQPDLPGGDGRATSTRSTAYLRLRELNPAPYAGFVQHDVPGARAWLLSSSPERYALVGADRTLETKPIKGTTPRGATRRGGRASSGGTSPSDPKIRAENLMIVDLLRNDLSMVCEPGTVEVPALMEVESYESVHQLVSTVRGRLRAGRHAPSGAARALPRRLDDRRAQAPHHAGHRGRRGDARAVRTPARSAGSAPTAAPTSGVVIRSLMTAGDGRYLLGTGGGITVRSDVAGRVGRVALEGRAAARGVGIMDPVTPIETASARGAARVAGWSCSSTWSRSPASARSRTSWRPTTPAPAWRSTSSPSPRSGRSGPASPSTPTSAATPSGPRRCCSG